MAGLTYSFLHQSNQALAENYTRQGGFLNEDDHILLPTKNVTAFEEREHQGACWCAQSSPEDAEVERTRALDVLQ